MNLRVEDIEKHGRVRVQDPPGSATLITMLAATSPDRLIDAQGRPYFLWDCDLTLDQFRQALGDRDEAIQAFMIGKLMRQAKPDDVFAFVRPGTIRRLWPKVLPHLAVS